MEIQPLKIGTKMAKVPVIQGGMGVGISLGNLAGAVAKEGGIGIISAAQPGFKEKDFEKNPPDYGRESGNRSDAFRHQHATDGWI